MEAYSLDLRLRVLAAVDQGDLSRTEIAELFGVSTAWVRRLVQRRRETGSITPRPRRYGPRPKLDQERCQQLAQLVQQDPDATLAELRQRLAVSVGIPTLWRALDRLGLTLKKSRCGPASRTGPTSSSSARRSARN
jgi:transposase